MMNGTKYESHPILKEVLKKKNLHIMTITPEEYLKIKLELGESVNIEWVQQELARIQNDTQNIIKYELVKEIVEIVDNELDFKTHKEASKKLEIQSSRLSYIMDLNIDLISVGYYIKILEKLSNLGSKKASKIISRLINAA